jgi:hypothetical protein
MAGPSIVVYRTPLTQNHNSFAVQLTQYVGGWQATVFDRNAVEYDLVFTSTLQALELDAYAEARAYIETAP